MPSLAAAVSRSSNNMDPEFLRARAFIQDKICDVLLHRSNTPNSEMQKRRIKDLAKHLEEAMLKTALSKHEIQVGLVDDLRKRNEELDEMTKERDRLSKWVEELESAARPAEDETEEEKTLSTRAQLIFKVRELEQNCLDTLGAGFKAAVEQLKVVNPEVDLVTKGINPFYKVVEGKIVVPEGFVDKE